MRAAVRKLRIEDVEKLQALVVEHFDAIEPGLTVLDARLLLGHATIDVIGVDSVGALVLGAVGFSANEDMLLKAVEAYSWCLEYPEALVRLYPSCQLSEDRPPRLLFVVERMPDAFHRKIKQLGFPEVDCVEFRHLEFDGVPTVYFESLLRLRRTIGARAVQPESTSAVVAPASTENVITMTGSAPRAAGVKLPKLGQPSTEATVNSPRATERPVFSREPVAVVSMVSRQTAVAAPWVERPRPAEPVALREPEPLVTEPVVEAVVETVAAPEPVGALLEPVAIPEIVAVPEAIAIPEPVIAPQPVKLPELPELTIRPAAVDAVPSMVPAHVQTAAQDPERVSFKDLADALLGATTATQEALAQAVAVSKPSVAEPLVLAPAVEAPAAIAPVVAPLELETSLKLDEPKPVVTAPALDEILALAVETLPVAPIAPVDEPKVEPALVLESMVTSPAPIAPDRAAAEPAKPAAPALPQGFEGLKFPNDGVLTRQWMEFLSQMSTTK
ncbi:MAG TPA: hypothetical protein VN646_03655 [Candidatus Acidoferrum sp.]|nr:hypothetical protein [Candidatus Acidoferrum sp.]